ncbi:hypothetical protein EMCRGX_G018587 [Ephydatia muelleri]
MASFDDKVVLYLRHLSGSAYDLLRNSGLKLPSQGTLRDYSYISPTSIGFSNQVDQQLMGAANIAEWKGIPECNGNQIRWSYLEDLYLADNDPSKTSPGLRLVPKLNETIAKGIQVTCGPDAMETVNFIDKNVIAETQLGIRITVASFVELVNFLFTLPGVSTFLSERLCQDPLEQFFGCQRQRGRTNDNPTVKEFCKNTQALRVVNSLCAGFVKGNCTGKRHASRSISEMDLRPLAKRPRTKSCT